MAELRNYFVSGTTDAVAPQCKPSHNPAIMSPDIILYAIIAVVLLARLWSLFGQRNDGDPQRPNPFTRPANGDGDASFGSGATPLVPGRPQKTAAPKIFLLPPASLAGGLAQIKEVYPAFDEKEFLVTLRGLFTRVVENFAADNLAAIADCLGPAVRPQFEAAVAARKAAGQTLTCHIAAIREAEITAARSEGPIAFVTVRIISEQEIALRDASGALIDESTPREQVTDIWSLSRDTAASGANWILVETRS